MATLPWARRKRLSLQTCIDRRFDVFAWLRWLADHGIERLTQVTQEHCERYLRHRQDEGVATSSLKSATLAIKDLARYDELFTTDRYAPGFMPWAGKSATMVAGYVKPGENVTPPVPDLVLRPALTAGLYLVEELGLHVADRVDQLLRRRAMPVNGRRARRDEFAALMARYIEDRSALPELDDHDVRERLNSGWDPRDPLLRLNFSELARELDVTQFRADEIHRVRDLAETAVSRAGVAPYWARTAVLIERADNRGRVPWTEALTANRVNDLAMTVFNAALHCRRSPRRSTHPPPELSPAAADHRRRH